MWKNTVVAVVAVLIYSLKLEKSSRHCGAQGNRDPYQVYQRERLRDYHRSQGMSDSSVENSLSSQSEWWSHHLHLQSVQQNSRDTMNQWKDIALKVSAASNTPEAEGESAPIGLIIFILLSVAAIIVTCCVSVASKKMKGGNKSPQGTVTPVVIHHTPLDLENPPDVAQQVSILNPIQIQNGRAPVETSNGDSPPPYASVVLNERINPFEEGRNSPSSTPPNSRSDFMQLQSNTSDSQRDNIITSAEEQNSLDGGYLTESGSSLFPAQLQSSPDQTGQGPNDINSSEDSSPPPYSSILNVHWGTP